MLQRDRSFDPMNTRVLLAATALLFLAIGIVTSRWISLAKFDDPFCYGRAQLWYAIDPASCYFSDAVRFFEPVRIEHYPHPGLASTFFAGVAMKVMQLGSRDDSLRFAVLHQREMLFVWSLMTTLAFLLCCVPLHSICRRVESESFANVNCSLFLASVPVLLFVNRFAPEPYMLLFALATMALSLRAIDQPRPAWDWMAMGAFTALAILSKPLVIPVVLVPLCAAIRSSGTKRAIAMRVLTYIASGVLVSCPLLMKVPLLEMLITWRENYVVGTWMSIFTLPDQWPFAVANLILCLIACVGGWLTIRRRSGRERERLLVLAAIGCLMILVVLKRPQWQYFFGFYWILTLFASLAIAGALRSRIGESKASVAAFASIILVVHSWRYPGLYATYKHYHDRYVERRNTPSLHLPAVWEKSIGDSDLSEIFPVQSRELEAVIEQERGR